MLALTDLGDLAILLPIMAGVAAIAIYHRQYRHAALWLAAVGLPLLVIAGVKIACLDGCASPFPGMPFIALPSSPSGHAGVAAAVYLCLALLLLGSRRGPAGHAALLAAGGLPVAIGISRVMLGVHSIGEVAAGLMLAVPAILAFAWALRRLEEGPRGRVTIFAWAAAIIVIMHGYRFPSTSIVHHLNGVIGPG